MRSSRGATFTENARRAQIVQAAIDTVNELGYPRASLAAIARRAGVAKSAIVYYFASKDGLLLHVVDHVFAALDELLERAVAAHTDPEARLRAYIAAQLSYVDRHRAGIAAGTEIVISHRGDDGVPLYLADTAETDAELLREILAAGMDQGVFRPMPLRVAVGLVESLLYRPISEIQQDLDADLTALLPEVSAVVLRGFAADGR